MEKKSCFPAASEVRLEERRVPAERADRCITKNIVLGTRCRLGKVGIAISVHKYSACVCCQLFPMRYSVVFRPRDWRDEIRR